MNRPRFEIGETNVLCTDADRSLAFYRDILGFEYVTEDHGAHRLKCGSAFVLLLPIAEEPSRIVTYGQTAALSFDLYAQDLGLAHDYLVDNGVEIQTVRMTDGYLIIKDPDGLLLEVVGP